VFQQRPGSNAPLGQEKTPQWMARWNFEERRCWVCPDLTERDLQDEVP
jgi:hypothetical protein